MIEECDDKPQCVLNGNNQFCYCCCIGNMCNRGPSCGPVPRHETVIIPTDKPVEEIDEKYSVLERYIITIYAVAVLAPIAVFGTIIYLLYSHLQPENSLFNEVKILLIIESVIIFY